MEIKIMQLYNCNFSVNKICKVAEVKIMLFKKKSIKVMEIKVKQKNIKCFTKNLIIKNYVELIMILKLIHICKSN